jgi:hypothetical protein
MSTREELSHWAKVEKSMKEIKKLLLRKWTGQWWQRPHT